MILKKSKKKGQYSTLFNCGRKAVWLKTVV